MIGTSRNTTHLAPVKGVTFLDLDVTSDESVAAAVGQAIQRFGRIDVLVNNAGVGSAGAAEENSVAPARTVFDINVFGVIRMTNAVLRHMRAQGSGRIINVSSVVGLMPQPYMAVYVASKHAVEGYSESVDHEVRDYGVRVLLVEPAWTNTALTRTACGPTGPCRSTPSSEGSSGSTWRCGQGRRRPSRRRQTIVAASTDTKPKLRYAAGIARSGSPSCAAWAGRVFGRQVRKLTGWPADAPPSSISDLNERSGEIHEDVLATRFRNRNRNIHARTQTVDVNGTRFACQLGPDSGTPVILPTTWAGISTTGTRGSSTASPRNIE